jgi:hypothetical protein
MEYKKKPPSNTQWREAIPKTDLSIYILKTVLVKITYNPIALVLYDLRLAVGRQF